MSIPIQRRTRNNQRYSPDGSIIVVDRTGNHKANFMVIADTMVVTYIVVFYSLRTARKYSKRYEVRFGQAMPIYDRSGEIVTHITK